MGQDCSYVLVTSCEDVGGIVAAVSGFLYNHDCFILESNQYSDPDTNRFFLRLAFRSNSGLPLTSLERLRIAFLPIADTFGMRWSIEDRSRRLRVLIAVSRFGHCLFDLVQRWELGSLSILPVGVVSNHEDMREFTEARGLPFWHFPVDPSTKSAQEMRLLALVEETSADLVVLARYMQVLSDELSGKLAGRCVNIHHSFLPGFKGAKPYHQAHARGVKIIGATAHYVTADLDEGPIIEQDVERVDHTASPQKMIEIGRDIEARVLARAVQWHAERRVMPNGAKTVIFR